MDQTINERPGFIPNEALRISHEARNPVQAARTQKRNQEDSFGEDRMSQNEPSDETVRTTLPDDNVRPG